MILFNPRMPLEEVRDIEQRLARVKTLDSHVWIATSGSTAQVVGQLKWIALSHLALETSARAVNAHLKSDSEDVWMHALPRFHVGGYGIDVRARLSGAKVVDALEGTERKWNPARFHELCEREAGTLSALVPTQVYDLVHARLRAPRSLRAIVIGGAAFSEDLYHAARDLGWPVLPSYGMTECCSQIATASLSSLQSQNYPKIELLSHVQVQTSTEGKLTVRSESLLSGLAILTPDGDRWFDPKIDGWFQSEDLGEVAESATGARILRVKGRGSDFIKVGGESVDLTRLQSTLERLRLSMRCPDDLALVPIPDERLGEILLLAVERRSAEATALVEAFNQQVLPFERIRETVLVERIPRSPLRKILKPELIGMIRAKRSSEGR